MDAGDWIALVAGIVAFAAMLVAIWQASEARRARTIAREQADIATKALEQATKQSAAAERSATAADLSAGAADRSAGAAEEQVVEARKAVRAAEAQLTEARRAAEAAERSARAEETAGELAARQAHEAAAPKFALKRHRGGALVTEIRVTMTDGSPLSKVTVRPQGNNAHLVVGFTATRSGEPPAPVWELGPIRKGEVRSVYVHTKELKVTTTVAVDLYCVPEDQEAQPWMVHETLKLTPPIRMASPAAARIPLTTERQRGLFHDRGNPF